MKQIFVCGVQDALLLSHRQPKTSAASRRRKFVGVFAAACSAVLLPVAQFAQNTSSRLSGAVTDSTGAVIANGTVVITNELTKADVFTGHTDASGTFTALELQAGRYRVTVEAAGFKRTVLSGVVLDLAQAQELPVTMEVGTSDITVSVNSSEQPQLENGTTAVSTVIDSQQVATLPLPNRDITQLIALAPGVVQGGDPTAFSTSQLSINGSRTLNSEFLLDGSSVINGSTGNVNRLPSPDFISEFRIIASTAPAEYGRTSGAVITAVSRSGTSDLHGTVYELLQNSNLNANSYFNKLPTVPLPRAKDDYNQFGFALGGPIYIPHFYTNRKKAFFFLNYDQTINRAAGTSTLTIPAGPTATGNFMGTGATIYDPLTGQPFLNNIIPTNRIDPAAARVIAALPTAASTANNYFTQQSLVNIQPIYSARLDYSINDKIRLFGTVTRQIFPAPAVVALSPALNGGFSVDADQGWESALGYTQEITPSLVLNLGFGTSRDVDVRIPTSFGLNPTTTFGIGTAPANFIPQLSITGYSNLGTAGGSYSRTYSNDFTYFGSITKIAGRHVLKFGGLLRKNQLNIFNPGVQIAGSYQFTGDITSKGLATNNPNNALADFLLGAVKTSSYGLAQPETGRRNFNTGAYGQDDFRLTPKLLLNAGVRWEYEAPLTIANNTYSRIDPSSGVLLIAGKNATNSLNLVTPKLDFAPRVGLVFTPDPKTVVRAAYGSFYGLVFQNLGGQVGYPGYENNQSFNNLGTGIAQLFTLSQGQPLIGVPGSSNPNLAVQRGTVANPYIVSSASFGSVNPLSLTQQWNAGVQQQFVGDTVLEVGYVGSHALHNPLLLGVNLPNPALATSIAQANTTIALQQARPFPTIGQFNAYFNVGSSTYNSLQVSARRQFTSGIAFSGSYTWSHSIDDGSGVYNYSQPTGLNGGEYPSDPVFRRTRDRSDSSFDVRNSFTQNANYTTKGPWYTRGFLISEAVTGHTGFPFTITQTTEFPGAASQRPNGTSNGLKAGLQKVGAAVQYLQAPPGATAPQGNYPLSPSGPVFFGTGAARTQVVPTSLGTLGRYSIDGPGEINVNASFARTFPIYERVHLQLRVDAFNLLNHTNFGNPNSSLAVTTNAVGTAYFNSPNFGQITTADRARFLQIVTRVTF